MIHERVSLLVPANVAQSLRYLLPRLRHGANQLGLFRAASFAWTSDRYRGHYCAKVIKNGGSDGIDTLFEFATRDRVAEMSHAAEFFKQKPRVSYSVLGVARQCDMAQYFTQAHLPLI